MGPTPYQLLLWAHLLCMVSIVGTLLVIRRGLPLGSRQDAAQVRPILRFAGALLFMGLVWGCTLYVMLIGTAQDTGGQLASQTHMLVGIKILLMVIIGACLGMSSSMLKKGKSGPAATLQWVAAATLALAALLGLMV